MWLQVLLIASSLFSDLKMAEEWGKDKFVRILKYIFQLHGAIKEFMTAKGGLCKTLPLLFL